MEEKYWIWLGEALNPGNKKIKEIYTNYQSAKDFYEKGIDEWRISGILTVREIKRISSYDLAKAEEIVKQCKFLGMDIITIQDSRYPERLKNIINPPAVLYVKGTLPSIDNLVCIAMVGTRNATSYGTEMAFDLSFSLAKLGALVISGGALGIDTASHKGALQALGQTVLVTGCGLNYNYLKENLLLRKEIIEHGAIISEYPPDMPPFVRNFPMRNRIISGLACGTVIVEAGKRSGSLITAELTLEQNRDLFAVPGNITSETSKGSNNLLKECAKPVTCALDIIEEYLPAVSAEEISDLEKSHDVQAKPEIINNLSPIGQKLYLALSQVPQNIDVIAENLKIPVNKLLMAITELEIVGLIKQLPGRMYTRTRY